ncbi:MAG: bifunctional 3-(3-hydroxy-phenyl)propionate/3-hydroxycinnamic acid hydroxylase [Rhizobiaceae bacterium]
MSTGQPQNHYDVAIVGLGPTGATLANLLGKCGVRVLGLDRYPEPYPLPRAVHFDDEIMRIFQTAGIADEITGIVRVNVGMRFVDTDGKLLLDWPRPQQVGPHGWYASYRFHQPELEKILRHSLLNRRTVDLRTGQEVIGLEERGDHVRIDYADRNTGEKRSVDASYVVGCDGANSLVRQSMGTAQTDLGFKERWLVVDLLLNRPKPELGDHTIQYCNPERPMTYARGPENRRRWEVALLKGESAEQASEPATVWRHLAPWISPSEAEIERAAVYTFHSILADQWRLGRLLIAGDAAHRTPPFMGQGMCAGVRDAANLAWKLARTVKGNGPQSLLETYTPERWPHAQAYIETAVRLGRLINASGTRQALDAAFRRDDGTVRMESISPPLGDGLGSSTDPWRGTLFPQPVLSDGKRMDDHCGYSPALIADRKLLNDIPDGLRQRFSGICIIDASGSEAAMGWLSEAERKAVLIRPDRYVFATASTQAGLQTALSTFDRETGG